MVVPALSGGQLVDESIVVPQSSDPGWASETGAELRQLLSLQFWLWGRDVGDPTGNLLIRYGFERKPAPDGPGHSRYELELGSAQISLWGWGIAWHTGERFAILLHRQYRVPALVLARHVQQTWHAVDMPLPMGVAPSASLLAFRDDAVRQTLLWIACYERFACVGGTTTIEPGYDFPELTHRNELPARWTKQARFWIANSEG